MIFKKSTPLRGELAVPGDKSISHRAVMLGALAKGTTSVTNFLKGADCLSTISCFEKMGIELDNDIAKDLYTAICSDTGCFKYSNVTSKTMRTAANLLEYDFDHAEVARLLFDSESLAAAKLKAEITENIKEYADGKIKAVITDEKIGAKYGMGKEDIPNLVDIPRRIEGTEIAVCIKRTNNGFRLNLRSNGKADVAEVAMKFGGGGHIKAAGATLDFDSTEKAEKAVIDACKKALDKII